MLVRLLSSVFLVAFVVVGGAIGIVGGYWLSDIMYDWGLWPIGAVMRIFLLVMVLGYVLSVIAVIATSIQSVFFPDSY